MSSSKITKPIGSALTHHYTAGDFDIYVYQIGNSVTVSGEIIGKGQAEYITGCTLPTCIMGNCLFRARCVGGTGAGNVMDVRTGSGGHYIYREASMASGSRWEVSFSYVTSDAI